MGLVGNVSTAALQGLFLYNKDDAEGAIGMVEQLAATQQSADTTTSASTAASIST